MKTHSPNIIDESTWQEIEFIFWRAMPLEIVHGIDAHEQRIYDNKLIKKFKGGHVFDGLIPSTIETSKDGIKIEGEYWLLPHSDTYKVQIFFERPNYTSVQSITGKKILKSTISEYSINTWTKETVIKIK